MRPVEPKETDPERLTELFEALDGLEMAARELRRQRRALFPAIRGRRRAVERVRAVWRSMRGGGSAPPRPLLDAIDAARAVLAEELGPEAVRRIEGETDWGGPDPFAPLEERPAPAPGTSVLAAGRGPDDADQALRMALSRLPAIHDLVGTGATDGEILAALRAWPVHRELPGRHGGQPWGMRGGDEPMFFYGQSADHWPQGPPFVTGHGERLAGAVRRLLRIPHPRPALLGAGSPPVAVGAEEAAEATHAVDDDTARLARRAADAIEADAVARFGAEGKGGINPGTEAAHRKAKKGAKPR